MKLNNVLNMYIKGKKMLRYRKMKKPLWAAVDVLDPWKQGRSQKKWKRDDKTK